MKYPNQIKAIIRQRNLVVDAFLSLPQNENEDPPLEMYSVFSRFLFTIRATDNGNVIYNKANVIVADVADITKRTDYALGLIFAKETVSAPVNANSLPGSPAYTVKLLDKAHKNQTPAEVLMKNPEAKEDLLRIREWLYANLSKYPNNSSQIEAIDDAISLLEKGDLMQSPASSAISSFKVYETENKYFTSEKEKDPEGNHKIYNISVLCEPGKKYPFSVTIMNCYAPVELMQGGTTQIKLSAAKNKVETTINLTEKEWVDIVNRMNKTMENFESTHASKQFELHKKHAWQPDQIKSA